MRRVAPALTAVVLVVLGILAGPPPASTAAPTVSAAGTGRAPMAGNTAPGAGGAATGTGGIESGPSSVAATAGPSAGDGTVPSASGGARAVAAVLDLPVATGWLAVGDPTRSTPPRGAVPGHPGRDLPTSLWFPAVGGGYPLLVFAHGFNTTPATYDPLARALAARGYVVAAPAMPGERSDLPGTPTQADIPNEPRDLGVVIDAVTAAEADPSSWLHGLVDSSRVGAVGHSDGGSAVAAMALNSATVDQRLRGTAVLAGEPWPIPGGTWGSVQAGSVLVAHGDADPIAAFASGQAVYGAARAPKGFLEVLSGDHMPPFNGTGPQADAVRAAVADFLDAEVRGDLAGLGRLAVDGNQPGLDLLATDGLAPDPVGSFESAVPRGNQFVALRGWAIDPDTDGAVPVAVTVDGVLSAVRPADEPRADLAFFFPSYPSGHGLDIAVSVGAGTHEVCLVARNLGNGTGDTTLGCRSVTVHPQVFTGSVVANHDGRLEVFTTAGGTVFHTWQKAVNHGWDGWWPLSGVSVAGPVRSAVNADGRMELFAVAGDGGLWHTWQVCAGCSWSAWEPLGGALRADRLAVAANDDGRLEVFDVDTGGTVVHAWQQWPNGPFSAWVPLAAPPGGGGGAVPSLSVGRQPDGRLAVVVVTTAGHLAVDVQVVRNGPWQPWVDLGGALAGAPAMAVDADGRLEAFAVGADHHLWHAWQTSGAGPWSALADEGGALDPAAALTVAANEDQRLEAFGAAAAGGGIVHVWQLAPNSSWSGFASLPAAGTGLASINNPDGRIELFSLGSPAETTHAWQVVPNGDWSGWLSLD